MQDLFKKYYSLFDKLMKEKEWKKTSHEPSDNWVVLINGERVILKSSKSLWKKKQFASCALTHDLKDSCFTNRHEFTGTEWWTVKNKVIKTWIDKHAEIIMLSEWIEEETLNTQKTYIEQKSKYFFERILRK